MAKLVIELSPTDTGHVIGDFAWDFCKKIADDSDVSTTGCTLVEYGNGIYSLSNPDVTADTAFRLHLTANVNSYASGIFSLSDDNMSLANADFNAAQKTSITTAATAATPTVALASVQPYYAPSKTGDAMTLTGAYDAAKIAASATDVAAIPTDTLLTTDARLNHLNADISAVAPGVWDVGISAHLAAGTTGSGLNAAGSAGDPWSTILPGGYGAGTAGALVGSRLDVAVSSRNDVAPDNGNIANIIAAINDGVHGLTAIKAAVSGIAVSTDLSPITSRLDNGTYGLSALMTAIGASGSGENDTAILSAVNVLETRLTDTRAALIDKLATPAAPDAPVIVIPTPLAGNLQTLWGQAKELGAAWAVGDIVTVTPKPGQVIGGIILGDEPQTATVDASGFFSLPVDKGAFVRVEVGDYFRKNVTITTDDSKNLGTY